MNSRCHDQQQLARIEIAFGMQHMKKK